MPPKSAQVYQVFTDAEESKIVKEKKPPYTIEKFNHPKKDSDEFKERELKEKVTSKVSY